MGRRWVFRAVGVLMVAGLVLGLAPIEPASGATATIVIRNATATSLAVTPASPTPFGQAVVLSATVKKAPGLVRIDGRLLNPLEILILFGSGIPAILTGNGPVTGSVTFFDGPTALATVPLVGGTASLTTTSLGVGTHSLQAVFAVSGHWHSSASPVVAHQVTKIVTSTVLSSTPNPSSYGQSVALTAAVSPSSAGGSVEFFDGAASLGSAPVVGGVASLSTSSLSVGSHPLSASYGGNATHVASTSTTITQVVNKIAAPTVLTTSPNPSTAGSNVVLTATVSPSSASGSVEFFDGAASLGSAPVVGGVASLSTSSLSVGNHALTATYSGDATHAGSTSSVVTQTVNKIVTSTTLQANPNPVVVGDPAVFTATVSPSSATGSVEFFDGATSLGSAPVVGGVASLSTSTLSLGNHTVTATYGGDSTHTASTSAAVALGVKQPDLIMSTDQALCGTHVFDTLEVPAGVTLTVAQGYDSTNVADLDGGAARQRCPVGLGTDNRGRLIIQARVVVIDGEIDGFAIQEVGPPSVTPVPVGPVGNGGAGHAGAGGQGRVGGGSNFTGNAISAFNAGGASYGDTTSALQGHPGSPANNFTTDDNDPNGWGRGGGVVIITATESVTVTGAINVAGGAGRGSTAGDCGQQFAENTPDDPPNDPDDDTPFIVRTGSAGDGGGSGGTIAIGAPLVDTRTGQLSARGGDGGHGRLGGGGGGSGGTTKIVAPTFLFDAGSLPVVAGGDGGLDLCAAPSDPSPNDGSYNDGGSNGSSGTFAT